MIDTTGIPSQVRDAIQELPVAYSEVDARGIIRVVNLAACRLHQMTAEEMVGHAIWEFVPGDEAVKDLSDFFAAMQSSDSLPVIRRSLYTSRGGFRVHELHRSRIVDSEGKTTGVASVTFDVSEWEAAQREAKQALVWLESAMTAIPQAVIVTDALGFVRYINPAAERLTGWLSGEFLGIPLEKRIPILRAESRSRKPLSFRITLNEPWHGDVDLMTRDRQTVSVWLSASPIFDSESGYTNGVVTVLGSPKIVHKESATEPV